MTELIVWTAGAGSAGLLVGALALGPGVYRLRLRRFRRLLAERQAESEELIAERPAELAARIEASARRHPSNERYGAGYVFPSDPGNP